MAYKKAQTKRNKNKRNNKRTKKRNTNKKHKSLKRRIYNKIYSDGGGATMSSIASDMSSIASEIFPEKLLAEVPNRVFNKIPQDTPHQCVVIINRCREYILKLNQHINLYIKSLDNYKIVYQKLIELVDICTQLVELNNKNGNPNIIDKHIKYFFIVYSNFYFVLNIAKKSFKNLPKLFDINLSDVSDVDPSMIENYLEEILEEYVNTKKYYNTVNSAFNSLSNKINAKHNGIISTALKIAYHPSVIQRMLAESEQIEGEQIEGEQNEYDHIKYVEDIVNPEPTDYVISEKHPIIPNLYTT